MNEKFVLREKKQLITELHSEVALGKPMKASYRVRFVLAILLG